MCQVFSLKGWEFSAQGKERSDDALGTGITRMQPEGLREPSAGKVTQGGGPSALALG